jgi:hypothetical protein
LNVLFLSFFYKYLSPTETIKNYILQLLILNSKFIILN